MLHSDPNLRAQTVLLKRTLDLSFKARPYEEMRLHFNTVGVALILFLEKKLTLLGNIKICKVKVGPHFAFKLTAATECEGR